MKTINSLLWLCWAGALLGLALHVLPAQAASGTPPDLMTYQGYLVDNNGTPLGNTAPKNYDVVFRIWKDQLSTVAADRLWTEQQTLTIDKGYFSVLLGEGAIYSGESRPALSSLFTGANASDRFIEVMVKGIGTGGVDLTIAPRLRFLAAPYAFLAQTAVNAQNLVNGTYAQVVNISGNNVGINKAVPASALDVSGTVTATGLDVTGPMRITGRNVLEFGIGESGKGASAGKIGYKWYDNGLNISGAGADGARVVSILAESGTFTFGGVGVNKGALTAGYKLDVSGSARVEGNVAATGNVTATGTITAASFTGNGTIPIGGIIMWSGTAIPTGWALCNGTTVNGVVTPDLRNRFVVGAGTGSQYAVGATGGLDTVTLSVPQIPPHSHTYTIGLTGDTYNAGQSSAWRSTAAATTGATGGGQAHENRPPYYALAYIMRVQ